MPGQEQQQARPAPPPGYFDVEASGTKPPPPPGYHDADAAVPQAQPSTYDKLIAGYNPNVEQFAERHPILGPPARFLDAAGGAAMGLPGAIAGQIAHPIDAVKGIGQSLAAWTKPETWKGAPSVLPEALGMGVGNVAAGDVAGMAGKAIGKNIPNVGEGVRGTIGKYSGISDLQSKIAQRGQLAADAVNSAKTAENAAHTEASAPYKAIAEKVKETIPTQQLRSETGDIAGMIEGDKIPGAIKDITGVGEVKRSTGPPVGGRHFDLSDPNDLRQFQRMKAEGAFTPQEISRMEGSSSEGIGFEQLKQMRSRLGREMGTYDGPAAKAAPELYNYLSQQLRGLVDRAGVLSDYKDAESGYKEFMDDWHNGHPIEKLLHGQDTNKIIDAFRGDTGKRVTNTLNKYGADPTPFQNLHKAKLINEPFQNAEADSGILSEKDLAKARLKEISSQGVTKALKSPWTLGGLAVGVANPAHMPLALGHAGLRIGIPKLLGTDFMGDWLTKGMSEDLPKIPPKKVLPKPPVNK